MKENVDSATKNSIDPINFVLDKYVSVKKVNQYKLRLKKKTWTTSGIQNLIYIKKNCQRDLSIKMIHK